jgi:hypothetical protein
MLEHAGQDKQCVRLNITHVASDIDQEDKDDLSAPKNPYCGGCCQNDILIKALAFL